MSTTEPLYFTTLIKFEGVFTKKGSDVNLLTYSVGLLCIF